MCVCVWSFRAFPFKLLINYLKINHPFQVCIVDYNEEQGKAATDSLADKFGADNVTFCKCDVTSQEQFEGNLGRKRIYFILVYLPDWLIL